MKTLYINLNGESVTSSEEIVVVGTEKDKIVNKFYIALGTEILDGVVARGVKKKMLVANFETERPQDFKTILEQWDEIRYKLLGGNPLGKYSVNLPNAYLEWLQYHQDSEYRKIYTQKFNKQKDVKVELDIKDLYDDTVELIISNIEPDDYNKIVVDDDFVTKKSAIVQSIKEEYPKIAFVPFEEFEWPKQKSTEEKEAKKEREEKHESDLKGFGLFPIHGITLGEKSVKDIKNKDKITEEEDFQIYEPESSAFVFIQSPLHKFFNVAAAVNDDDDVPFPKQWADIMGLRWGLSFNNSQAALRSREFKIRLKRKECYYELDSEYVDYICAETPDGAYFVELVFEDRKLKMVFVSLKKCPNCGKDDIWVDANGNFPFPFKCKNKKCGYTWTSLPREDDDYSDYDDDDDDDDDYDDDYDDETPCCPECGSDDVTDDGSGYLQYRCNDCDHVWGDDDDD